MDLVISFDSTGSMQPCISEVKRKVEDFTDTLFKSIPDLRIHLIVHGDYNDRYDPKHLPFTTDQAEIARFLKHEATGTSGHGNGGECYEWILAQVNGLPWKSDKRAFIMIGDEPAHYKGKRDYTFGHGFQVEFDWQEEAAYLKQKDIKSYIVRCLNRSDSIKFHTGLSKIWETPLLHLHQFADSAELITSIAFVSNDRESLKTYATELEEVGKLNRNLSQLINSLLGEKLFDVPDYAPILNVPDRSYSYTRNSGRTYGAKQLADGLNEVDPTRFQVLHVDHNQDIKSFVLDTGATFKIGRGFYELTKREEVQEKKEVILQDRKNGIFYSGKEARDMIGLPFGQRGNVKPEQVPAGYTAFIQSTSNNRKLMKDTRFLYDTN